jgi:hypothetical protein
VDLQTGVFKWSTGEFCRKAIISSYRLIKEKGQTDEERIVSTTHFGSWMFPIYYDHE